MTRRSCGCQILKQYLSLSKIDVDQDTTHSSFEAIATDYSASVKSYPQAEPPSCYMSHNGIVLTLLTPRAAILYSVSSGWKTKARTSMLSLAGWSSPSGSTNAVCGTRLARPSVLVSKHLIRRTSSGVRWCL